ncbi:MAG: FAD-dependent oxidoreductase, partial [Myxococcota bacterium]
MSDVQSYDTVILGAGQAGPTIARALTGRGERVAMVEAARIGGTCLNVGCRPTKALRASARVAQLARSGAVHGVHA